MRHPRGPGAGPWVVVAAILGSSMVFIDGTVVNVALPAIQSDLHATIGDVQWVVEAYALSLASMLLTGGSLGDLVGRRKVFAIGVALFGAASAWCGLAPSVAHLIAARAVQGIGGALLVPGSLALISVSFAGEARGRAIGTWSAFTSITAAIGPVLGGWLVQAIEAPRSRLAAIETTDPHLRRAIAESFISGYRVAVWIAAALALGASVSAAVLIDDKPLA